jgi:FAD/FMN-containing dehydrogenase
MTGLLRPGDDGFEDARRLWSARWDDVRPQVVARCSGPADVIEALRLAAAEGLPVAVRSGGHDFAGRSATTGVLVDVTPMADVAPSPDRARVRVGAGARLGAVYDALAPTGRTVTAGCGPSVGVSGLALGGGLGVLGRAEGLLCDTLLSAEVVLADGRVVTCDAARHPDLLWALRGAGAARIGVVCALELATVPAPELTRFRFAWAAEHAAALLGIWQDLAPDAPRELAVSLILDVPAEAPAPAEATVFGVHAGTPGAAEALLAPLLAVAPPDVAEMAHAPHHETKAALGAGDAQRPRVQDLVRSECFERSIPPHGAVALVEHLVGGRADGQARQLDFGPLGGAYADPAPGATAYPHRAARFMLKHAATVAAGAPAGAAQAWADRSFALAHPWGTGGVYPNFPEPGLPDEAYWGANVPQLRRAQAAYGTLP